MDQNEIKRLIDSAKGAFQPLSEEPLVSDDWVVVREIGDVLERLTGAHGARPLVAPFQGPPGKSAAVLLEHHELLHDSLIVDLLIGFTVATNTVVPAAEWAGLHIQFRNRPCVRILVQHVPIAPGVQTYLGPVAGRAIDRRA